MHHLYFKCKFVSVSIKKFTVLPVWSFICISTGAFFANVQLWVLHELIPVMCCHLSPRWCITSGLIIYISAALWKATLILGVTKHYQKFSSQIRGRQRPLRHLLHAIKEAIRLFLCLDIQRKTKQQSTAIPSPNCCFILAGLLLLLRSNLGGIYRVCRLFVLVLSFQEITHQMRRFWPSNEPRFIFCLIQIVSLVLDAFLPVFHIRIDSGCLHRWSSHSDRLILEGGSNSWKILSWRSDSKIVILKAINFRRWDVSSQRPDLNPVVGKIPGAHV